MMSSKPPTLAYDLDRDVQAVSAMASSLTPYLYEDEMYGFLSGDLPKLTLGGLLMRLYRLTRLEDDLDADQRTALQDARINFEAEQSKWAVHYEGKLQRELQARLNAVSQYLHEYSEDPQANASGYPSQAEKRLMIEHLQREAEEYDVLTDELETQIKQVDHRLQRWLKEEGFIFDSRLEAAYPRQEFWWLYGYLPESK